MERATDVLERWELFGAGWRVLALTDERAVVELRTCHGEPVDRLVSSEPELLELVRRRRSSEE
jgi:hypothetical protein